MGKGHAAGGGRRVDGQEFQLKLSIRNGVNQQETRFFHKVKAIEG
jgi:hypothetical protein